MRFAKNGTFQGKQRDKGFRFIPGEEQVRGESDSNAKRHGPSSVSERHEASVSSCTNRNIGEKFPNFVGVVGVRSTIFEQKLTRCVSK